jgi:hypothetical protein
MKTWQSILLVVLVIGFTAVVAIVLHPAASPSLSAIETLKTQERTGNKATSTRGSIDFSPAVPSTQSPNPTLPFVPSVPAAPSSLSPSSFSFPAKEQEWRDIPSGGFTSYSHIPLQHREFSYVITATIKEVGSDWILLRELPAERIRLMPRILVITTNTQAKEIPFPKEKLQPGRMVLLRKATRPDRDYIYTDYIWVYPLRRP